MNRHCAVPLRYMKFLLSKKMHMTQFYDSHGTAFPATVLTVDNNLVTAVRTVEKNGYSAVQVASFEKRAKNTSKAALGTTGGKAYERVQEFRVDAPAVNVGDVITVDTFAPGDVITATGISKGKGFQGVVKRHGFKGGRRSHGQKHSEREPGSIGGGGRAGGRVAKGMRMAGRMGGDRVTIKNLTVLATDKENGVLLIKGAVPGKRGDIIELRSL